MDPITIILALLLVGAAGLAAWLFVERGRLLAGAAGARATTAAAEVERARVAAEAAELRRRLEDATGRISSLEVEETRLREQARAEGGLHRAELEKYEELYRTRLRALEQQREALE